MLVEASFGAAFIGGLLALLAPCSALLLPAFFACAFANRVALLRGVFVFLLGLLTILLPLGLTASLAGRLFIEHRPLTIAVAGAMLVLLGLLVASGRGLPVGALARPGQLGFQSTGPTAAATYASGVIYGLTGFCSGPLLGGVLTLAAAGQQPGLGAALLLVYALGMTAPLLVLAAAWDRLALGKRRWLRGGAVRLGGLRVPATSLAGGGLFVLLGALFIVSQGGSLLSGAYDDLGLTALGQQLESWVASFAYL